MIFRKHIPDPYSWHDFFCWVPVKETIVNPDRSVTIVTYWMEKIQRRLIHNKTTQVVRWDYRKSISDDEGVNAV